MSPEYESPFVLFMGYVNRISYDLCLFYKGRTGDVTIGSGTSCVF